MSAATPNGAGGRVVHALFSASRAPKCGAPGWRIVLTEQPVTCKRCLASLAVDERTRSSESGRREG